MKENAGAWFRVLTLLIAPPVFASDLCITVMDLARLPLASASVSAANLTGGQTFFLRSDKNGNACFSGLPEGLYSIEASLTGFLHVKYYPVRLTPEAGKKLSFWLPFGEITEGGLSHESTISGTLFDNGSPVGSAEVCLIGESGAPKTCTTTNDLGEYALVVSAGVYQAEVRTKEGTIHKSRLDVSIPGIYRNRLSLDGNKEKL